MREKTQRWAVLSFSCAVLLCLVIFICKDTPGLYPAATTCSVWTGSKHESLVSASSEYKEISETAESGNQFHNSEKVNINTASWEELTALEGIGDVLAKRIVAYQGTKWPVFISGRLDGDFRDRGEKVSGYQGTNYGFIILRVKTA